MIRIKIIILFVTFHVFMYLSFTVTEFFRPVALVSAFVLLYHWDENGKPKYKYKDI